MPKRVLEGHTPAERVQQRSKLGTLRQLTVQPATRRRYENALDRFMNFLKQEKITLPTNKFDTDPIVCDYLEHLWSAGQGRALASDTLASLQDKQPNLRHCLPGAWRLMKTWSPMRYQTERRPFPSTWSRPWLDGRSSMVTTPLVSPSWFVSMQC